MSRTNAFLPIWPPTSEHDFDALPEVRKARLMFSEQVECLRKLADQALRSPTGTESRYLSQEIATLLHNISGTAAYFDRAEFGTFAMHAETRARAAFTADLLRPLCREILAELSIDDPD